MSKQRTTRKYHAQLVNLILSLAGLVTTVFSFLGCAGNFVSRKSVATVLGNTVTNDEQWKLGAWFDNISDMANYHQIGHWQVARVMFIITAVLLVLLAGLVILRFFVVQPTALRWTIFGFGSAVLVSAFTFLLTTSAGCRALSTQIGAATVTYVPDFGVFVFGVMGMLAGILALVTVGLSFIKPRKRK